MRRASFLATLVGGLFAGGLSLAQAPPAPAGGTSSGSSPPAQVTQQRQRVPGRATTPPRLPPAPPRGVTGNVRRLPERPPAAALPSRPLPTPTAPDAIANAQLRLQGLGLYRGPINGLLTGPTRAALRVFQSQARIPQTGFLDRNTGRLLGLDTRLRIRDARTIRAIEQLQISAGLPVTGQVDEATRQFLETGFVPIGTDTIPSVQFTDTLPTIPLP